MDAEGEGGLGTANQRQDAGAWNRAAGRSMSPRFVLNSFEAAADVLPVDMNFEHETRNRTGGAGIYRIMVAIAAVTGIRLVGGVVRRYLGDCRGFGAAWPGRMDIRLRTVTATTVRSGCKQVSSPAGP